MFISLPLHVLVGARAEERGWRHASIKSEPHILVGLIVELAVYSGLGLRFDWLQMRPGSRGFLSRTAPLSSSLRFYLYVSYEFRLRLTPANCNFHAYLGYLTFISPQIETVNRERQWVIGIESICSWRWLVFQLMNWYPSGLMAIIDWLMYFWSDWGWWKLQRMNQTLNEMWSRSAYRRLSV